MFPATARFSPSSAKPRVSVNGTVAAGFERVRELFADNFTRRHELGGACCAYYRGEKVVDLWGGIRNKNTGEPWDENTMVIIYSATKGLAAMTMALAHSRGWLDFERTVASYWPEFAQHGKGAITVRQLLAHQAGLFALDEPVTRELVSDLDRLAAVLARQTPAWPPGARQAYHGITLGFYESELLRRIDPQHRTVGQFFQDEIATPLRLDVYIRLPETIPDAKLAVISRPGPAQMVTELPLRFLLDVFNRRSNITRALDGSALPHDNDRIYARGLEIPSGGAVGTARAIARAYSAFAQGGELGLTHETLALLAAPATPSAHGLLRRMHEGRSEILTGLHEAQCEHPVREPIVFRIARRGRRDGICRSGDGNWLRLCDEPDGHDAHRRSA